MFQGEGTAYAKAVEHQAPAIFGSCEWAGVAGPGRHGGGGVAVHEPGRVAGPGRGHRWPGVGPVGVKVYTGLAC